MSKEKLYNNIPEAPGVYLMKGARGRLLYVGKAGNLKKRVSSYFLPARHSFSEGGSEGGRPHDSRIQKLVSEIKKIDYKETNSALEALILESELIKKHQPPYNIREKDDKSFLYVEITKEKYPRVLLVRGKDVKGQGSSVKGDLYGPFTSASQIREALRIIRKIFPYSIHPEREGSLPRTFSSRKQVRGCFDYEVGLCPGTCIGEISVSEYKKNIKHIKLIFSGKTKKIIYSLKSEMKKASAEQDFEKAGRFKKQLFAIQHIQDSALVSDNDIRNSKLEIKNSRKAFRVEGYDISNISGTSAVGSMVVFTDGKPDKDEYRRFKIKNISQPDDTGMISEVISRRFSGRHKDWKYPDLILIDGGKGQVNVVEDVLKKLNIKIPVVGIAKGAKRKNNRIIGKIPEDVDKNILIRVRDEAHRFAISYHRKVRNKTSGIGK